MGKGLVFGGQENHIQIQSCHSLGKCLRLPVFSFAHCEALGAAPTRQGLCDRASKALCTVLSLHEDVTWRNWALFSFLLGELVFQIMHTCCFQSWTCVKVDLELF